MIAHINGPSEDSRQPATVVGTEHGDTWKQAVDKMNENFAALVQAYRDLAQRCAALEGRLNSAANPSQ